jgi:hypothetical protein
VPDLRLTPEGRAVFPRRGVHDLNEQGWRADVIERQLAHCERNEVRGAYNRAEYLPARVKMMQAWADYVDAIAAGGKVLPFRLASAPSGRRARVGLRRHPDRGNPSLATFNQFVRSVESTRSPLPFPCACAVPFSTAGV